MARLQVFWRKAVRAAIKYGVSVGTNFWFIDNAFPKVALVVQRFLPGNQ